MTTGRRAAGSLFAAVGLLTFLLASSPLAQAPPAADVQLREARQAYEQVNFEAARDLLSMLIGRLTQSDAAEAQRKLLAAAYELRGRALQNLRDIDAARADFRSLLTVEPNYQFPAEAGARAAALFEEVRAATVGTIEIAVTPADADVQIDQKPVTERPLRISLVAGFHAVSAARRGHRPAGQQFEVRPGESTTLALTLERELTSLTLQTIPPGVTVILDGTPRGTTLPNSAAPAAPNTNTTLPSQPFVIEELQNGRHRLEFRRACFTDEQRQVDVQRPESLTLEPVTLAAAVGTITVRAEAPGATVFVDNTAIGAPPQVLNECVGPHVVEVRTRIGRQLRRFDVKAGQKEEFVAVPRPAFAIVSDGGTNGNAGGSDPRLRAETLFRDSRSFMLFAPPRARTDEIAAAGRLPADWLAFDALGNPLRGAASIDASARRSTSARFAQELDAQGVAAILPEPGAPGGDGQPLLLVLLAPGSARPDVLRFRSNDAASVRQALERLDTLPPVTQASLGMLALDVLDVRGVVVGSVDPGGGAAAAGLRTGDIVTSVDGTPVTTAAGLLAAAARAPAPQRLALDVRDLAGTTKKVEVAVQTMPRLPELLDNRLLSNALAVALSARRLTPAPPVEEASVRLNLAVAWIRLENWEAATRELEGIEALMAGAAAVPPRVKEAIVANAQYLLGLCAAKSGNLAAAEQAWTKASLSSSTLLSDNGEPLKELSERRLAELRASRSAR